MTDVWSYPSLKCILEYLEANKRIHITARSSVLQKFENSIPLHIDLLCLSDSSIQTNYITHKICICGDFVTTKAMRTCKIPIRMGVPEAVKTATFYVLDGRGDVYVKHLRLHARTGLLQVPADIKLKIRKLEIGEGCFRDGLLSVISPSSYPLRELKLNSISERDLNRKVLKSATKLIISSVRPAEETWFLPALENLTNKEIVIEWMHNDHEAKFVRLIETYLRKDRKIGSCLTIGSMCNGLFYGLLRAVKSELGGKNVKITKPVERLSRHTPCSIPIDSWSAALIYGITSSSAELTVDVKVEIVSTEAGTQEVWKYKV